MIIIFIIIMQQSLSQNIKQDQQVKLNPTPYKSFNAEKKEYEKFWKFIYLGISIISAMLFQKIYKFQTIPQFKDIRQGTPIDILVFAVPFSIAFTLFDLLIHHLFDYFCQKYCLTEERYEGEARNKRAYTLVKWAYSLVYYFISSVSAYYLIKETSFFPSWLGGHGDPANIFNQAPKLLEATHLMKLFYLFQLGKHLSRLASHMFIRAEGNYYQYVLHHALSTFLILFSYLTNQWLIGIMVLLCHDTSDFFLISCRLYKDTKFVFKPLLQGMYVVAFLSWIFFRLIVFPLTCVLPSALNFSNALDNLNEIESQVMTAPYAFMILMMAVLLILQIFWTYYILQSFLSVNVTSKVSHNYD